MAVNVVGPRQTAINGLCAAGEQYKEDLGPNFNFILTLMASAPSCTGLVGRGDPS